jgi:hypothetical protein
MSSYLQGQQEQDLPRSKHASSDFVFFKNRWKDLSFFFFFFRDISNIHYPLAISYLFFSSKVTYTRSIYKDTQLLRLTR